LQARVLDGKEPVTCRPADLIDAEMDRLTTELRSLAKEENIKLATNEIDDVLIYALFQQVGINFLKHRNDPDAFEPAPGSEAEVTPAPTVAAAAAPTASTVESYRVSVNGTQYDVVVGPGDADTGSVTPISLAASISPASPSATPGQSPAEPGTEIKAPLAGSIIDVLVAVGDSVSDGDPLVIVEAMKMETEIRASCSGKVLSIAIRKGDAIQSDQSLMTIG
jgi:oxaloacetate decarboxylase alpha subunit